MLKLTTYSMGGILSIVHLLLLVLLCGHSKGDPRSQTVEVICSSLLEHNTTAYVPNFLAAMDSIGSQIRTDGFGKATVGSGPDANYGLSQCHGDLSSLDCVLCYAEARTILPKCFPNNGGRIYLDGCFMRAANYSFFSEYTGPEDTTICGNKTSKGRVFEQAARQGLLEAVTKAPENGGYAKISVPENGGSNRSAYVLANCWRTLNETTCKACLENASASAVRCLPWSEGRVLNTGCFLRYSDTNFLNPDRSRSLQRSMLHEFFVVVLS